MTSGVPQEPILARSGKLTCLNLVQKDLDKLVERFDKSKGNVLHLTWGNPQYQSQAGG